MELINLNEMKVKELREIAKDKEVTGRWDMNKTQLVEALTEIFEKEKAEKEAEEIRLAEQDQEVDEEAPVRSTRGRRRTIEVYKDGVLIKTVKGLLKTFDWVRENQIANQGWVKRSLKTGEETKPGFKFKEGGYLFKYAD